MKFTKLCLVVAVSLVFTHYLSAQVAPSYELPKILPTAPTAAAFARYNEIPVDISTGVPKIEIPLYVAKSRSLEVPITLSYHASGIKVNDISTPVGLGWVVSGMGMVSRTVLDWPDEGVGAGAYGSKATFTSKASYQEAVNNCPSNYSARVALGSQLHVDLTSRDRQSDRFNYTLPGKGGSVFRYDFDTEEVHVIPYRPVKINRTVVNHEITSFTITDEDGTTYYFDNPWKTAQSNYCTTCYNGTANTAWYLSKMKSADGMDSVTYHYFFGNKYTLGYYSQSSTHNIIADYGEIQGTIDPNVFEDFSDVNFITTYEPLLWQINTTTTSVEFEYASDRSDWGSDAPYRLASIKIKPRYSSNIIKEIFLDNNSYFGDINSYSVENKRLQLRGISIKGNTGVVDGQYEFTYNGPQMPPYNTFRNTVTPFNNLPVFAEDYWGYFNGSYGSGLIPTQFLMGAFATRPPLYKTSRKTNPAYSRALTINTIKYPTGGTTTFNFEPNYGLISNSVAPYNDYIGGLRVHSIVNESTTKVYEYFDGKVPHLLDYQLFNYSLMYESDHMCAHPWGPGPIYRYIVQSSSFASLTYNNGANIVYPKVIEYTGSENIINPANSVYSGKTEYYYNVPKEYPSTYTEMPENWTREFGSFWFDNGTYEPQLLQKKVYKYENNSYSLTNEILNTYQRFRDNEFSTGVNVLKTSYDIEPSGAYSNLGFTFGGSCPNQAPPYIFEFSYVDSRGSDRVELLTGSEEKNYDGTHVFSTKTTYTYGDLDHLQPTEVKATSSEGSVLTTENKYPADFVASGGAITTLIAQNRLTPIVEQIKYVDTNFLESVKTNFTQVGQIVVPQNVESKLGSNSTETRLRYDAYDEKGNPLTISKENDVKYSYIWGYKQQFPIAQAINTNHNCIYHTSFEETGGSPFSSGAKTGTQARTSGTFTQTINTLANGNYELTYWKWDGTKWTPQQVPVVINNSTNGVNGTYTINISGTIDEVRFYPKGAQMITNTYDPLIGVTSTTDANGQTTYYEYDHMNRLSVIRDNDKNIVKKTGYSMVGRPEDPVAGGYYNAAKSGSFVRQNCSTGYIGKSYSYRVPQWKYHSSNSQTEADQLAQNDVNANGQALANLYGECIPQFGNTQLQATFTRNNCGPGYYGTNVTYTAHPNTYRGTTQAEANAIAQTAIDEKGQAYANHLGGCYNSTWPFIKLTYENSFTQSMPNGSGGQFDNFYQDVVVRFYQDEALTIPITVSNIQIKLNRIRDYDNQGSNTYPIISVTPGSMAILYDDLLFWGYDINGKFVEEQIYLQSNEGYNVVVGP